MGPPNALPFSGLGAAKPALRFYADASAATRSATACSAGARRKGDSTQTVPLDRLAQLLILGTPVPATSLHKFYESEDGHRIIRDVDFVATGNTACLTFADGLDEYVEAKRLQRQECRHHGVSRRCYRLHREPLCRTNSVCWQAGSHETGRRSIWRSALDLAGERRASKQELD